MNASRTTEETIDGVRVAVIRRMLGAQVPVSVVVKTPYQDWSWHNTWSVNIPLLLGVLEGYASDPEAWVPAAVPAEVLAVAYGPLTGFTADRFGFWSWYGVANDSGSQHFYRSGRPRCACGSAHWIGSTKTPFPGVGDPYCVACMTAWIVALEPEMLG